MYGYATNMIKTPNINAGSAGGRRHWNFVKTDGAMIRGNMPATSKAAIAKIFDGGLFFWNPANGNDNIGNFNQSHVSGDTTHITNPIV
jgi:hypothetical protein